MPATAALTAANFLREARDSLDAGAYAAAAAAAREVVDHFPRASGSAEALLLLAEADLGLGEVREAADAAQAFRDIVPPEHPAFLRAGLALGEALRGLGDPYRAAMILLETTAEARDPILDRGRDLLRETLPGMRAEDLQRLVEETPSSHPLRSILLAETAVALLLQGDGVRAAEWARAALDTSPMERERERARAVLSGDREELVGRPIVLGAILPGSQASPTLQQYGAWIREGIQVALEVFADELDRPVLLEVAESGGRMESGATAIRSLEEADVLAVVGPLLENVLGQVAESRETGIPVLSPTAIALGDAEGVLSLAGPDVLGVGLVARFAWEMGLERVVILAPDSPEASFEAREFRRVFEDLGGIVPREIVYAPGASSFQAELGETEAILPDGLFLPLPSNDVRVLAPQVTYYGLDTLGIQILGTNGWAQEEVLVEVDTRHTDGVIASTTRAHGTETGDFSRFRRAYEATHQKTLRSRVPALGYDAAALILEACKSGNTSPAGLRAALNRIRDFPGATGTLSVVDGRIVRDSHLVRLQNHELIDISPRFD